MTKENQLKIIEELQAKNQKLLLTLIQVATSPGWDAKQIRSHVQESLKDVISNPS